MDIMGRMDAKTHLASDRDAAFTHLIHEQVAGDTKHREVAAKAK
jgi:hypothetical protein